VGLQKCKEQGIGEIFKKRPYEDDYKYANKLNFDTFCKAIEFIMPDYIPLVKKAKLFLIDSDSMEKITTTEAAIKPEVDFFMPFPEVAFEWKAGVVLLADTQYEQKMDGTRKFIEAYNVSSDTGYRVNILHEGEIWNIATTENGKIMSDGMIKNTCACTTKGKVIIKDRNEMENMLLNIDPSGLFLEEYKNHIFYSVGLALKTILILNTLKGNFILEEKPVKIKKAKKRKYQIPRSNERPKFTILSPKNIREKMGIAAYSNTGRTVTPHERRRHARTYPEHGRWKSMAGKTIIIPATWVGPSTAVRKNKKYKVRLDL